MHSIVHDLINNTGRAIKRKVGNMLSKKSVMDLSSSGWTTFRDEGSTEPDHSPTTIHNQTGPLVQRLNIDFGKNISKEAKTSPSTKKEREPVEKVKVSFFSGKVNDSKVIQQPSIQRNLKRVSGQSNNSSLAQETSAGNKKRNMTDKTKKTTRAVDTRSLAVSNVKPTTSSTKRGEQIPDTSSILDQSSDNKKKALTNSIGGLAKIIETNLSHTEHEVRQHAGENNSKRNQTEVKTNSDQIGNFNVSDSVTQLQSGVTHVQEETNKQIPVEHVKQSEELFIENDKISRTNTESRNNESSSTLVNNGTRKMVSKRPNVAGNKTGKTRVLETLKISFLGKNRTWHWNQNNTHNSVENALETQRNVKLDNETNSKADSRKVVASPKSRPAGESDKKRASVLNKENLNFHKPDVVTNGANSHQTTKGDREISNTKGTDNDTSAKVQTTTSTKAEKIIVNLSGKEQKSQQNKPSIATTSENHKEVDKDTQQENLNGKILNNTFPENTKMAKTDLYASSTPRKIESSVIHNKEQKMNTSSSNIIHKRAGRTTSSLTATNVQEDRKHLKPLQNGPGETSKNVALNSSKVNKTIPKENIQVTKKDIIPSAIDSESSQNNKAGIESDERSQIESERTRNALNEISKQPVNKMMDKANANETYRVSANSRKSVGVSNHLPKKKRIENTNISTTNTLERSNNSQEATGDGKGLKKVQEDVEFPNLQKHQVSGHDDLKKDQSNAEIRTFQNKSNTEIKTKIKSTKPKVRNADTSSSMIQNSTSITLAQSAKKVSENPQKDTHHPHEKSLIVSKKDRRISPGEPISSHKDIPENPKIDKEPSKTDRENGTMHVERAMRHGSERRLKHDPGSGVTHDPVSAVAHAPKIAVTDAPGSGLTHDPGSGVTHYPGNVVKHDAANGATRDPDSDVVYETKAGKTSRTGSNATPFPKSDSAEPASNQVLNSPKRVPVSQHNQSSQLLITSERSPAKLDKADLKFYSKSSGTLHKNDVKIAHFKKVKTQPNSAHVTQASRRTKEEERQSKGHHVRTKENSKNDDKKERTKMQNSSSGTDPKPTDATKEDIEPSKVQRVDVLTSRTPPTSLLTTSNDDNTYSIKQIVQGPKGSSFVYANQDDEKIRKLEKKVFKLESEVTVLETAMADLAKRLLVVEQKPEIPPPKATATFPNPSNELELHAQHPAHSQQQTTVYITKDLGMAPQNPVPQNGPDKIVIPISSLYPGRASSVSIPSSSQHVVDRQEAKVDNQPDEQDQEKPQDSAHVTLHQGTRPTPISEAHAVVRPIVNIIVPNNRADLLSEGAICMPRCQNGGRCFDRNICRCPTFFTGDHCERFSLRDLLESPAPRQRPYRKLQRLVVSESPDRQVLDGTLNLDSGSPALEYRDLNQDLEPDKEYVAKQQPVEVASPSNGAEVDGATRRRQLILEI